MAEFIHFWNNNFWDYVTSQSCLQRKFLQFLVKFVNVIVAKIYARKVLCPEDLGH